MIRTFCVNFCDDIRHEVGKKISLIGIYGTDLNVPVVPAMIPKLCIYVQLCSEVGERFDEDIELRVLVDDTVISTAVQRTGPKEASLKNPAAFQKITSQIIMSPFLIEKESTLRVRAFYKGVEYKAAALRIRAQSTSSSESAEVAR